MDKSGIPDFLKDNLQLLFILKKTERISSAIYLITAQFPDAEPLKRDLRESSVVLIKDIMSFRERASMQAREFVAPAISKLIRLLSLLDLAHIADFLSFSNFAILRKELLGLATFIEGKTKETSPSSALLDEHFFGIPRELFSEVKEEKPAPPAPFPRITEETVTHVIHSFSELEKLNRFQKEPIRERTSAKSAVSQKEKAAGEATSASEFVEDEPVEKPRKVQVFSRFILDKINEERRERIVEVISKRGSATIKDISNSVKNCSEKTLQRRLLELVEQGILQKEGKKRWSRYSLSKTRVPAGQERGDEKPV